MASMGSYRFQDTLNTLEICYEHLSDMRLSVEEDAARQQIIALAIRIVQETIFGQDVPRVS